ncbi:MAG: hypothetical protein M3Y27_05245 [Acidobacteriota bacterium]|nr:hypothetical protein [Acidobacteriota bacterium]
MPKDSLISRCRGRVEQHGFEDSRTSRACRIGSVRFSASWTWAHSIDDTSGESSNSPIQNSRDLAAQRGSSTFDVRHKVTVSGTYELPFGKGKLWLNRAPRPVD